MTSERRGLQASLAGSLLVACAGLGFYFLTEAEAILLDGLFNLTYFVSGLFTLKVASLVRQEDNERFPVGYAAFEPLVNGSKGVLMLGVDAMALVSALESLFTGGREIELGLAVLYALFATGAGTATVVLVRRASRQSGSPLVEADAKSWVVNAIISSAMLATLVIVWLLRDSSLRFLTVYVDPTLVIVVCLITIGVPIRLAWGSLMELLNRTPSLELLAEVRDTVARVLSLSELPVAELNVRMIQLGRTRTVLAHVLLSPASVFDFDQLDATRARAEDALRASHPNTFVDVLFTRDPRFAAPLQGSRSMPTIERAS